MFDDLDKVDWEKLGSPDAPQWIQGLVSESETVRDDAFDGLKLSDIYDRGRFARFVLPYIIHIVADGNTHADIALLLTFLKALRSYASGYIRRGTSVKHWMEVMTTIDNAIEIFQPFLQDPDSETRDAAEELLAAIEGS